MPTEGTFMLNPPFSSSPIYTLVTICQTECFGVVVSSNRELDELDSMWHRRRRRHYKLLNIHQLCLQHWSRMADPTGLSTAAAGPGGAEVDVCTLEIERKYEVIPAVICSMCCLFGIIYCFFGGEHTQHSTARTHAHAHTLENHARCFFLNVKEHIFINQSICVYVAPFQIKLMPFRLCHIFD